MGTSASRRARALEFIRLNFDRFDEAPSQGEIARELDIPQQRVGRILDQLEREGHIYRIRGVARGIRLPGDIDRALRDLTALGFVVVAPDGSSPLGGWKPGAVTIPDF